MMRSRPLHCRLVHQAEEMKTYRWLTVLLPTLALLVSCSPRRDREALAVSGSSTLAPMMEVLLEDFAESGFSGPLSLDSIGTRAGFARFLEGSCDVVTASRAMTPDERRLAEAAGMRPEGFVLAMDAVAVCTGGGIEGDISIRELRNLLAADRWNDVRIEWPDTPVAKYYPGLDSGTFAFIVSAVYDGDSDAILSSSHLQLSEDDHVLVQGLLGDPFSIGFFGYSYYLEKKEELTLLPIGGKRPVDRSGYPLARPLYLYIDASSSPGSPAFRFVDFALEQVASGAVPGGFLAPSEKTLVAERAHMDTVSGKGCE